MNPLVLACVVVCAVVSAEGSEVTYSTELSGVTGGPSSGEGLQSSLSDDDEVEADEDVPAGTHQTYVFHMNPDERRRRKGKGRRRHRQQQVKSTTSVNPEYSMYTYQAPFSTTQDPCTSTHLGFCIHGYCKHMEGLPEPVCICMKGYDGERCGIQTLLTGRSQNDDGDDGGSTELVQTVLVVIAVVLSVISCAAIVLMTCAHYRSHKHFLASYLGSATEQEKLQKPSGDAAV